MLRKFRIKINEKEYMVEMEEFGAPAVAAAPAQAVAVQAAPVAAPVAFCRSSTDTGCRKWRRRPDHGADARENPGHQSERRRCRDRKPSAGRIGSHETGK